MTRTIIYKGKSYNGVFISITFDGLYDIYIDRQARCAILMALFNKVISIIKLESYQIDILLGDEDEEFFDELEKLEERFENEIQNDK